MLGETLASLRKEKRVARSDVSASTDLTEQTIYALECGKQDNPTTETLRKLADYYGVTVGYLLGETDERLRA